MDEENTWTHKILMEEVANNTARLERIEEQLDPLKDIAKVADGLKVIGRMVIWLGGVGAGMAVLYQALGE